MYDEVTVKQIPLGLLVGAFIFCLLCGCRAISKGDTPTAPVTPPASAGESKPTPTLPPTPTPQTTTSDSKDTPPSLILREAVGQNIINLINGELLVLQKNTQKGGSDPNITLDGGKFEFNQPLQGDTGGPGQIHATGTYQKLGTTSGDTAIYTSPTTIDFNFEGLQVKSGCYGNLFLTGNVHCTLSANYAYGTHTLNGTGQCMTHTNGILDNIRLDIGGNTHKVRYVLGFKVHGDPLDWKAYLWTGTAFVGGIAVDITQLNDPLNICNK